MKGLIDGILHRTQAEYLERLMPPRTGALASLERLAARDRVPIVDPEVGRFLEQTCLAANARRVLEVGTAIGYSTVHLARGVGEGGRVLSIDVDPQRQATARAYLAEERLEARVEFVLAPGLEAIPRIAGPLDLLFLDAIKEEYRGYLDLALPKLRIGGIVVCDNLLWSGQVAGEVLREDERSSTLALREFNPYFTNHPQLLAQVLSFGDGVGFAVKVRG
ncbi:MAG: O-methyltransferase [Planctomycetes bacterium]|nr:O-methyltransferase [Planctomycetota bacterium]